MNRGNRPPNRPVCDFCGTTCYSRVPCEAWKKAHPQKPYQWMSQQKLVKLLDYVLDRGLISVRKLTEIMDCKIEDISRDI